MNWSLFCNLATIALRASTLGAKFLLVIFLVTYFQPEELGMYGVLTAVIAYALFFLGLEFYNFTSRALVGVTPTEQIIIIRDQFILYFLTFIVLSPFFYLFFYTDIFPYTLWLWFFVITLVEHASNELMRIFIALARPHFANIIFFIRQGLWICVLLPIFYLYPATRYFNLIFIAWLTGASLSIVIALAALHKLPWGMIWVQPVQWRRIVEGLKISRPFMISAFCALSLLYIERFFVNYYCGIEAVGIYTFYAGLSITLHTLVNTGVARMRLAQLISAWKENNSKLFYNESINMLKYTIYFVIAFSIICVALIIPFITLLNKPVYLHNIQVFYFLLLGAACRSVADVPLYTLYAQHKDRLILTINLTAFVIIIVGNSILVPHWGLTGAAVSSATASLVLLLYSLTIMMQRTIRPFLLLQS
ncbi:MAG: polysaccharide biosynthesis C-terminal domain-containing protein [Legionella sp.]|nr:polysaccharide biosynthesis C-terminal domain-containing protein [Legionella sp.]